VRRGSSGAGEGLGVGRAQALWCDVGVALRRRQGGVPQDLLDTAQVGPSAEHVGGSGVAQPVGAEVRDPGGSRRAASSYPVSHDVGEL